MPNSTIVLPARRIITMDPDRPEATAVAVSGGRITDVGAFEDLRDTGAIDDTFADAVLCPGLIDQHLHPLLGVHTSSVRTVFLGDPANSYAGIVELLDLGVPDLVDAPAQSGLPARGVFLLSVQVDVRATLERLAGLGFGGSPRTMPTPDGGLAATVVDPDGVMVELLNRGRLSLMEQ